MPLWFWIVGGLAVAWNLIGVAMYLYGVTISEEALAALPQVERELHMATPPWVIGAFAIAVFAGLAGSLALLLRRGFATPILGLSLLAVLAQTVYVVAMSNTLAAMGASGAAMPAVITAIAAALLWFSFVAKGKGWLR
ncbi:MAG: hypothetical protein WD076_10725 [Parvularculaceae bacterium]